MFQGSYVRKQWGFPRIPFLWLHFTWRHWQRIVALSWQWFVGHPNIAVILTLWLVYRKMIVQRWFGIMILPFRPHSLRVSPPIIEKIIFTILYADNIFVNYRGIIRKYRLNETWILQISYRRHPVAILIVQLPKGALASPNGITKITGIAFIPLISRWDPSSTLVGKVCNFQV